jgi:hypothetical protein
VVFDADGAPVALQLLREAQRQRKRRTISWAAQAALQAWLAVRGTEPGALFVNPDRAGKGSRLTGNGVYSLCAALGKRAGVGLAGWWAWGRHERQEVAGDRRRLGAGALESAVR